MNFSELIQLLPYSITCLLRIWLDSNLYVSKIIFIIGVIVCLNNNDPKNNASKNNTNEIQMKIVQFYFPVREGFTKNKNH